MKKTSKKEILLTQSFSKKLMGGFIKTLIDITIEQKRFLKKRKITKHIFNAAISDALTNLTVLQVLRAATSTKKRFELIDLHRTMAKKQLKVYIRCEKNENASIKN